MSKSCTGDFLFRGDGDGDGVSICFVFRRTFLGEVDGEGVGRPYVAKAFRSAVKRICVFS